MYGNLKAVSVTSLRKYLKWIHMKIISLIKKIKKQSCFQVESPYYNNQMLSNFKYQVRTPLIFINKVNITSVKLNIMKQLQLLILNFAGTTTVEVLFLKYFFH